MIEGSISKPYRVCICLVSILASAVSASQPTQTVRVLTKQETAVSASSQTQLERLMGVRDDEYERQRLELFRNAKAASEIPAQAAGADPVTSFVARTLRLWLLQSPLTFDVLEKFIVTDEPQLRADSRSALPGGGSTALLKHIEKYENRQQVLDYLLLRALMRPKSQAWVYGALLRYFNAVPVHEPEVWIRIALQHNDKDVLESVANQSLKMTDQQRTLRALNFERSKLRGAGQVFPEALEALRHSLSAKLQ
jgi:hypothetical protein